MMAMPDDDGAGLAPIGTLAAAPPFASRVRPSRPPVGMVPAALATDADLLAAVAKRDDRALAALYDRHGRTAYALAWGVLKEPGAAEGVVQDAFLALWRGSAPVLAGCGDVRLWLLGQVRLRATERLRGVSGLHDATRDGVAAMMPSGDPRRAADALRQALAALPDTHLRALRLAYFGGLTCRELADREGVPVATVRARLRAGLAAPANRPSIGIFPGGGSAGTTFTITCAGFPAGAEITSIIGWYTPGLDRSTYRLDPGQTAFKLTIRTDGARAMSYTVWLYANGRYMGPVDFVVR